MSDLTHLDEQGRPRMVDVSDKAISTRTAVAQGEVACLPATIAAIREGSTPKGSVIGTAELAGIMAAKRTADLIPLCHPLPLTHAAVEVSFGEDGNSLVVRAEVRTAGPTGVEMEALAAVSVACLTLFDMLKAIDRTMVIGSIKVVSKTGGNSGDWGAL